MSPGDGTRPQDTRHGKSVSGDRSAFGVGIKELGMSPAYGWKRSRLNRCQQKFLKGQSFKETALKNKKK